jgi:aryl hydrocarbon receptor
MNETNLFLCFFCVDDRGKILLGYSDAELSSMGGYDMVHYDDLAYVASAHQECKCSPLRAVY